MTSDTSAKPNAIAGRKCPQCGVAIRDDATSCWLCLAKFSTDSRPSELEARTAPHHPAPSSSLSSVMMFVTLVCVVLGAMTISPGLGAMLAFVAFFAWLRTVIKVRKASKEHELTASDKVLVFFRSVAATVMLIGLVLVACAAAFFIACCVMLSGGHM